MTAHCSTGTTLEPPLAILAELTHRCPLRCAYCSNPLQLDPASRELDTATWCRVLDEAAEMGVIQVHFSGGEPTARKDLETLVAHATQAGLYVNLITSAVLLDRTRLKRLRDAGLQHVQVGFQDTVADKAERISGFPGGHPKKLEVARDVTDLGLALTVNAIVQRHNIDRVDDFIDMALDLGAGRIEIANVQYYGWALKNRGALMPTHEQLIRMDERVRARLPELKGRLVVDYVVPDYYGKRPKACMGGWGSKFLNINPSGAVLPCHAAETIPGLTFDRVTERPLADIWANSAAFQRYRGTDWMPARCRSCDQKEVDWGGCRCQALALTGNADNADPVCELSEHHGLLAGITAADGGTAEVPLTYRSFSL
ncbi:pyrroloquinoline quinone biosynthesis protein PqqE [Azospirillum rugosum]|uniref:PqqA peptide cyclase n=1 Tax=Azospirillum rugosum TaxID=416170 RepID=A0ABS4SEY7_9PROT|nr:pyrroloquinoline quinone biosynthesis protein PqqE [Azospirillum rugosum]MBP2291141.1 pyrroloquinoline quinone biosynthesis protein E [Azospirillum rugosum]MDQ0524795.1 pyrroloquinoline quinone biosynthesis protein E [Azospirillum rugosum]